MPKLIMLTARTSNRSTVSPELKPSVSSFPVIRLAAATAGIVSPIVAQVEPSAMFKLRWSSFFSEARKAARASGINASVAMKAPAMASACFTFKDLQRVLDVDRDGLGKKHHAGQPDEEKQYIGGDAAL